MADKVTAKSGDAKFKSHDEGQFVGQCVDCIDLGETVADFANKPKYLAPKCVLVFRTGEKNEETGEFIDVSAEFTVSMGEKANLRKFAEQWRGKPYTAEQIEAGVPLDKFVGNWALLTVAHKTSKKERVYAIISAAVGVPKQMRDGLVPYTGYVRAEWWSEKKKEYAIGAAALRQEINAPSGATEDDIGESGEDFADDGEGEESLPFRFARQSEVATGGLPEGFGLTPHGRLHPLTPNAAR